MSLTCEKCNRTFEKTSTYKSHMARKNTCSPNRDDLVCECDKKFNHRCRLKTHQITCNVHKESETLKNPSTGVTINNNNYVVNMVVNIFNSGDMSALMSNVGLLRDLLKMDASEAVIKAFQYMYQNPDNPERQNIIIGKDSNMISVSKDGKRWIVYAHAKWLISEIHDSILGCLVKTYNGKTHKEKYARFCETSHKINRNCAMFEKPAFDTHIRQMIDSARDPKNDLKIAAILEALQPID